MKWSTYLRLCSPLISTREFKKNKIADKSLKKSHKKHERQICLNYFRLEWLRFWQILAISGRIINLRKR